MALGVIACARRHASTSVWRHLKMRPTTMVGFGKAPPPLAAVLGSFGRTSGFATWAINCRFRTGRHDLPIGQASSRPGLSSLVRPQRPGKLYAFIRMLRSTR